ncbi:MAG TPA: exopolysaccharide biosynthesis polyprenyl glycosylphosphotransferase [Nitrospira sp.]|nr:exopolysaccharide biosynthesis polyprenyl glycosylphosphotransferase [Nitrospira sp.]
MDMRRLLPVPWPSRVVVSAAILAALTGLVAWEGMDLTSWLLGTGALLVLGNRAVGGRRVAARSRFVENVLVIGETELARPLIAELKRRRRRYRVLDLSGPGEAGRVYKNGVPFVGSLEAGLRVLPQPHRIVVALGERRGRMPVEALLDAKRRGIAIEDAVQFSERLTGRLALDRLHPSHLIFSAELRRMSLYGAMQHAMSLLVSAIGLVLTAPVMAVIAILIKWDSPGPVLFVQERIGKDGKPFPLMKFRTMHPVTRSPSEWVRDNGMRITRVGRWLRKFRLDELPQLFNVLCGHMNLVGPRPHPVSNYALFLDRIPFYAFRTMVRPGITGWAQVRYGYANDLQEETEKMRYDLYYIKYQSFRLDLEILLRTIGVVMLGRETRPAPMPASTPDLEEEKEAA